MHSFSFLLHGIHQSINHSFVHSFMHKFQAVYYFIVSLIRVFIDSFIRSFLGPVQTSHFTCAEYNTYLRRLKLVISTFDSDVAYNCPAIKSFPDPDFVPRFFQNGGQE